MNSRHIYHRDGTETFLIDGREVTREEYERTLPDKPIHHGDDIKTGWRKPILSDALAVHPSQIPEAMERDKRHGLNIEYTPDGRPKITSQSQKRAMIKSLGVHENNCYYSLSGLLFMSSLVIGLLFGCCPTAIAGGVITVAVDSVDAYGMSFSRLIPHVGKECSEGVFPSFTNSDSSTSVVGKAGVLRVVASRFHACPASIFGYQFSSCSRSGAVPVNPFLFSPFLVKASATFCLTVFKRHGPNYFYCAAITNALPKGMTILLSVVLRDIQTSKTLPLEIGKNKSHWFTSCLKTVVFILLGVPSMIEEVKGPHDVEVANEADNCLPKIEVSWDAEAQSIGMKFKTTEFRTWDMVCVALEMALSQAKFNQELQRMQNVNAAMAQQMQSAQLAHQLKKGGNGTLLRGR